MVPRAARRDDERVRHTPGESLTPRAPARAFRAAGAERIDAIEAGLGDWRRFAGGSFRAFHAVGFSQGTVGALAGGAVTTPLLLALGAAPAFALLVAILPSLGSLSQLVMPGLLRRTDGNLRGVTLLVAIVGDTRGFWYAGIVALAAAGAVSREAALAGVVAISIVAAAIGGLSGSNLLAWYHVVLPERERRFVSPRTGAVGAIAAAALLAPTALLLHDPNLLAPFVIPFLVAGFASVVGIGGLLRLPHPGRVTVPDRASVKADRPAGLDRFIRVSVIGAVGAGLGPPLSIYAIVVLGLSPGFTVALSALATLASLVASTVVSSKLDRGSSSQVLRFSHAVRAVAMGLGLLAFPGNPAAALLLIGAAVLSATGDSASGLASSERILRLSKGPAAIAHQAHYVAATSSTSAGAQFAAAGLLAATASLGYPAYAVLFLGSAAARVITASRLEVAPVEVSPRDVVAIPRGVPAAPAAAA
jgi:hypothetical protein